MGAEPKIVVAEDKELPLYPYHCIQCGHRFEKIQSFKSKPEKKCPKCGGKLERTLTAPGLNFKGAGWYVNDYAAKSGSRGGEAAPSEAKPETKSEAKSETKTEAKAETKATPKGESGASSPSSSSAAPSSSSTAS